MRFLEPGMLTFLVTSKCTAECRHCCMNSGPDRNESLTYADIERILTQVFAELDPKVIVFTGGEPMLLGEDLLRALRLCKQHDVATRVVTNGYWATSPEAAHARLEELREAGLGDINISTDDYHLPWISLARVKNAVDAAREIGFDATVISTCFGPDNAVTPSSLNRYLGSDKMSFRFAEDGEAQTEKLQVENGKAGIISNVHTMTIGRGAEALLPDELFEGTPDSRDEGGCPWAVRWAAVSPRGHLVSCCGFEAEGNPILDYGDLKETPLSELLDRADGDLITNAIATFGPPTIKRVLETLVPSELKFRSGYRGMCEVCYDLVTIPENRGALLRNQGVFAEKLLQIRSRAEERKAAVAAPLPGSSCHDPQRPETT